MIKTVFDSDRLPEPERLPLINRGLVSSSHPMRVRSAEPLRFRARVRELDLHAVSITEFHCSPAEAVRSAREIRSTDPETYAIILTQQGRLTMSHRGKDVEQLPGQLFLGDCWHPFAMRLAEESRLLRATVPRSALPFAPDRLDRLLPFRIATTAGLWSLLGQTLTSFVADAAAYRPADAPRLGSIAIDLLSAALAHELDAERDLAGSSRAQTMLIKIDRFIEQHLGDHDLSPRLIAAELHISVSYLHRLFEGRGSTVASTIRARRLERARRDLADPALSHLPIHRIAARWGFADHATFTRAFKAAYDVAPSEVVRRRQPLPVG